MRPLVFTACALAAFSATALSADVTLESRQGELSISGKLLSFENGVYTVETAIGSLELPADLVICSGADCPSVEEELNQVIRIAASESFLPQLLPGLISELAAQRGASFQAVGQSPLTEKGMIISPDNQILATLDTQQADGAAAFDALFAGDVELILTERRVSNAEIDRFLAAGLGDLTSPEHEVIFGQDGVAVIVSPANPVNALSVDQIEAVFSGQITNWSQLGGTNAPIRLIAPDQNSSVARYFTQTVLDRNFSEFSPRADRSFGISQIDAQVAADPNAIGLTSSANVTAARIADLSSQCGIQTSADDFIIRAEDYPMTRRLYAYTTNRRLPSRVSNLVDLMQSVSGQRIVDNSGFTSLLTQAVNLNSFGQRMAYSLSSRDQIEELNNLRNFASEVLNATRLSTTFRFATGSSQLDGKARSDVERLTVLLQEPQYAGAEILLVGFTDSIGRSAVNTVLSQRRAAQVLDEMARFGNARIDLASFTTLGFGASNPVACNTDETGRNLNRRVEVWVR